MLGPLAHVRACIVWYAHSVPYKHTGRWIDEDTSSSTPTWTSVEPVVESYVLYLIFFLNKALI